MDEGLAFIQKMFPLSFYLEGKVVRRTCVSVEAVYALENFFYSLGAMAVHWLAAETDTELWAVVTF